MTNHEALRVLGFTKPPADHAELDGAFRKKVTGTQARMKMPASKINKDDELDKAKKVKEAYDILKRQLGPPTPPSAPAPPPARTPPPIPGPPQSSQHAPQPHGARPPHPPRAQSAPSGATNVASPQPQPAQPGQSHAPAGGAPQPQPRRAQPLRPIPGPYRPTPRRLHPVYTAIGAVAMILLAIFVVARWRNAREPRYEYVGIPSTYLRIVPMETHKDTQGNIGHDSMRAQDATQPSTAPSPIPSTTDSLLGPQSAECWVKLLSYPVTQVSIDERDAVEAPGPAWYRLAPGWHCFEFRGSAPDQSLECGATLSAGRRYVVRVDLQRQTHEIVESGAL